MIDFVPLATKHNRVNGCIISGLADTNSGIDTIGHILKDVTDIDLAVCAFSLVVIAGNSADDEVGVLQGRLDSDSVLALVTADGQQIVVKS